MRTEVINSRGKAYIHRVNSNDRQVSQPLQIATKDNNSKKAILAATLLGLAAMAKADVVNTNNVEVSQKPAEIEQIQDNIISSKDVDYEKMANLYLILFMIAAGSYMHGYINNVKLDNEKDMLQAELVNKENDNYNLVKQNQNLVREINNLKKQIVKIKLGDK